MKLQGTSEEIEQAKVWWAKHKKNLSNKKFINSCIASLFTKGYH